MWRINFYMDIIFFVSLGAGVGFFVGLTGVGGGSLMTPLLVFSGVPIKVAIGTDLLYAAITKSSGAIAHNNLGNIHWRLVFLLAFGSIPSAIATAFYLQYIFNDSEEYLFIFNRALGFMLIVTSILIFLKIVFNNKHITLARHKKLHHKNSLMVIIIGVLLGILVTLSSVGAGAFCAALLFILYPKLPALHIIGTDIAHAVPLTFVAGLAHMIILQSIDWKLLLGLLIGSLPAVQLGARIASKVSSNSLQFILGGSLFIVGSKFLIF
jgi:uncharacterized membrane protein YfcA